MILKNIKHFIKLFKNNFIIAWKYDVLIEKSVTIKYPDSISFGKKCTIQSGVYLYGSRSNKELAFGNNVVIGSNTIFLGEGGIRTNDYTHFGPNIVVTSQYGDSSSEQSQESIILKTAPIEIGKGCWIGAGSTIMPGTKLGNNCIVYPNSVVYGIWRDNTKLSGNPARKIKTKL